MTPGRLKQDMPNWEAVEMGQRQESVTGMGKLILEGDGGNV
jgi:hypothetical protein